MRVNNPERAYQDESGQWWLKHGKKSRLRVSQLVCANCGIDFIPASYKCVKQKRAFCTRSCGLKKWYEEYPGGQRREKSARWTGGRIKRRGYVLLLAPDHPNCQGNKRRYVLEHRLVMEAHLGRYLESFEVVHHKNGVKDDNRLENLELWTRPHPYGVRVDDPPHCETCTCGA